MKASCLGKSRTAPNSTEQHRTAPSSTEQHRYRYTSESRIRGRLSRAEVSVVKCVYCARSLCPYCWPLASVMGSGSGSLCVRRA